MNWPYVAGFFDGEGYLAIRQTTGVKSRGRGIQPNIAIGQADKEGGVRSLEMIQGFLRQHEIACSISRYVRKNKRHRDLLILRINGRKSVSAFVRGVLPYLIVRRVFAQDVLRFLIIFPSLPRGRHQGSGFRHLQTV